jgi:hypothetical protein
MGPVIIIHPMTHLVLNPLRVQALVRTGRSSRNLEPERWNDESLPETKKVGNLSPYSNQPYQSDKEEGWEKTSNPLYKANLDLSQIILFDHDRQVLYGQLSDSERFSHLFIWFIVHDPTPFVELHVSRSAEIIVTVRRLLCLLFRRMSSPSSQLGVSGFFFWVSIRRKIFHMYTHRQSRSN